MTAWLTARRPIDPVLLAAGLALVFLVAGAAAAAGLPAHRAEQGAAVLLVLLVLGTVAVSAQSGLLLVALLPAAFSGEPYQPYFFLVDVAIVATLAGGLLERRRGGPSRPPPPPSRALPGLFLLST